MCRMKRFFDILRCICIFAAGMCATSPMDPARSVTAMDWSTMYPGYYDPQQQAVQMMNTSIPVATPSVPTSAAVVSAPPVTNPQTGQPDYSLAWVEYYRSIGLHAQADYILSHAAQNNLISTGAGSSMTSSNGAVATSTVIPTAQDQQNQQSSGVITTAVDQSLNSQPWNNTSSVSQTSNPQSGLHPSQQPQLPQIHHHMQMGHQTPTGMPHQPIGSMPMQQPQMQPHLMHQQVSGMQQIPAAPPQMPPPPPPPSHVRHCHHSNHKTGCLQHHNGHTICLINNVVSSSKSVNNILYKRNQQQFNG
ncbi:hypothetical protein GJ496_011605 [Pomphorhynchus laevis]|nr:hypothetical protein GJ496_011605 [Pomphorhynchus laevis]